MVCATEKLTGIDAAKNETTICFHFDNSLYNKLTTNNYGFTSIKSIIILQKPAKSQKDRFSNISGGTNEQQQQQQKENTEETRERRQIL
jgi:hypothetical protein